MKEPKILLFDIETSPNLAYTWGKWEQNVIDFEKEWELLCFAYKWLGDTKIKCKTRIQHKDKTDKALVKELWELFEEADIIIAHNGDAFDIKKAKAKFLEHGLKPPSPYKTIDTKKVASHQFQFNSNKLDDLGKILGVGRKIKHEGFELWLGCMQGCRKSWAKMAEYNRGDVALLERVYLKLRAWMPRHPNLSLHVGKPEGCPNCGSAHFQSRGVNRTATGIRPKLQCQSCFAWFSGAFTKNP